MPKSNAFKEIEKSLAKEYLGKPVPSKYQKKYGEHYDKNDIKSFSYAVAKSRGVKIEK